MRILFSEKNPGVDILDHNTGRRPYWIAGDDLDLQFAMEHEDGSFLLAGDAGSVEVVVREATFDSSAPKRMARSLSTDGLNALFTADGWVAGDWLGRMVWSTEETPLEIPAGRERQEYFVYAKHIDQSGNTSTFGPYIIECRANPTAATTLLPPDPIGEEALTKAVADGFYVPRLEGRAVAMFRDNSDRMQAVPAEIGQFGVQQDTGIAYRAVGLNAGDWLSMFNPADHGMIGNETFTEDFDLAVGHAKKLLRCNPQNGALAVTIPAGLPVNETFYCVLSRTGEGQVEIQAEAGVILEAQGTKIWGKYTGALIQCIDPESDRYQIYGDVYHPS